MLNFTMIRFCTDGKNSKSPLPRISLHICAVYRSTTCLITSLIHSTFVFFISSSFTGNSSQACSVNISITTCSVGSRIRKSVSTDVPLDEPVNNLIRVFHNSCLIRWNQQNKIYKNSETWPRIKPRSLEKKINWKSNPPKPVDDWMCLFVNVVNVSPLSENLFWW